VLIGLHKFYSSNVSSTCPYSKCHDGRFPPRQLVKYAPHIHVSLYMNTSLIVITLCTHLLSPGLPNLSLPLICTPKRFPPFGNQKMYSRFHCSHINYWPAFVVHLYTLWIPPLTVSCKENPHNPNTMYKVGIFTITLLLVLKIMAYKAPLSSITNYNVW